MKLGLKVSGKKKEIEPIEGWTFERRPGGVVLATSPQGRRVRLYWAESRGKLWAQVGGSPFYGEWILSATRSGEGARSGDSDLVAQFPGKVRKVLVSSGASVKEGDPLLLVEAMKMEFAVKAPSDGIVSRVCVKEGQQLNPGDRFVDFESVDAKAGPA